MSYILVRLKSGVVRLVEKYRIKDTDNKFGQKSTEISYGVMSKPDFNNLREILMKERNQDLRLLLAGQLISKYEYMRDMVKTEMKNLRKINVPEITKDNQKYIKKSPEELKVIEDKRKAFIILKQQFLNGEITLEELNKEYKIYMKKIAPEAIKKPDKMAREKAFKSIDFKELEATDINILKSIENVYTKYLKSEKEKLRKIEYLKIENKRIKEYEKFKSTGFNLKNVNYDKAKIFLNNKIYWLDDRIKNEIHLINVTKKMGGSRSTIKQSERDIRFYNELKKVVNKTSDEIEMQEFLRSQKVLL
jgi:hypothetical protein